MKTTLQKALVVFFLTITSALGADASAFDRFSIVAMPDTQYYVRDFETGIIPMTSWIAKNTARENILFLVNEGDITDWGAKEQWLRAVEGYNLLDGILPYALTIGNHDNIPNRTTKFNQYFPLEKFSLLGGTFEAKRSENSYHLLKAGDEKLLFLLLEFGPREKVLDWANDVIKKFPDHQAIIVTHAYMDNGNTRIGKGSKYNPNDYYKTDTNDGDEIWEKVVRKHPNVLLVLSGHQVGAGVGKLVSTGDYGNKIYQMLANYQMRPNGGEGFFRLLTFVKPAGGNVTKTIEVKTFSPILNTFLSDADNEFKIDLILGDFVR